MGIDAIALLHCNDASLLARLATDRQLGAAFGDQLAALVAATETGAAELPIPLALSVLDVGRDWAKVYTGVRFREIEADPVLTRIVVTRILESLPAGAHVDPRGMLVYPDVAEPRGRSYDDLVQELAACPWVSTAPLEAASRRSWQRARMAKLGL